MSLSKKQLKKIHKKEHKKLKKIHKKIVAEDATTDDKKEFLHLIRKNGSDSEMLIYMKTLGFDSIEEIEEYLSQEDKDEDKDEGISTGLAIAGGAILLALLLSK